MFRIPKINSQHSYFFDAYIGDDIYGEIINSAHWKYNIPSRELTYNAFPIDFTKYHTPIRVASAPEDSGNLGWSLGTEFVFDNNIRIWEGQTWDSQGANIVSYEIIPEPSSSVILGVILTIGAIGLFIRKVLK